MGRSREPFPCRPVLPPSLLTCVSGEPIARVGGAMLCLQASAVMTSGRGRSRYEASVDEPAPARSPTCAAHGESQGALRGWRNRRPVVAIDAPVCHSGVTGIRDSMISAGSATGHVRREAKERT